MLWRPRSHHRTPRLHDFSAEACDHLLAALGYKLKVPNNSDHRRVVKEWQGRDVAEGGEGDTAAVKKGERPPPAGEAGRPAPHVSRDER